MKHLLIVYHSHSGHTEALCRAACGGAETEAVTVRLVRAAQADLQDLLWADGVIFGSPENFGTMSGMLKDFFERTFYPAEALQLNLPYCLLISAGNDGSGAVREIERIAKGYPLKKVAEALIARGEPDPAMLKQARDQGQALAAGLVLGVF